MFTQSRRRVTVAAATLTIIGTFAPAAAGSVIQGLHSVEPPPTALNSSHAKSARAYCPATERVIGGGGSVFEQDDGTDVALTGLQPVWLADGKRDAYVVNAAETAPGTTGKWRLRAYAMCATPLAGLNIYTSPPPRWSSRSTQTATAICPAGQRAIGSGGTVNAGASGRVVLQVARPSHSGDIVRVQGHEGASGYHGNWNVTAYAVCAPPPDGYDVAFSKSTLGQSARVKTAGDFAGQGCASGKRLLSMGAATSSAAPGAVSLQQVVPLIDPGVDPPIQRTLAIAVENTPTSVDWDFIFATAVCAM